MSEEETKSVEAEASEVVAPATEPESVQEERMESVQEKKRRNDVEYNWAEARRNMQELGVQNRDLQAQLTKIQQQQAPPVEEDEIDKMGDGDIVTKAQAKKLAEKMARQIANDVIRQREIATVDERLQLKFSDFADVVTKENIEILKQTEPELAMSLYHNPDPFAQGVAAYKLIKRVGVGESKDLSAEKAKALKNSQKPISVNTVTKGSSALGNAHIFENGLTPELKAQLWKEMQQAAKGA